MGKERESSKKRRGSKAPPPTTSNERTFSDPQAEYLFHQARFKDVAAQVSGIEGALKKYEKTVHALLPAMQKVGHSLTTFYEGDVNTDRASNFEKGVTIVDVAISSFAEDMVRVKQDLETYLERITTMKKRLSDDDKLLSKMKDREKHSQAAQADPKSDEKKTQSTLQKFNLAKAEYISHHQETAKMLKAIVTNKGSDFESRFQLIVKAQKTLFSKMSESFTFDFDAVKKNAKSSNTHASSSPYSSSSGVTPHGGTPARPPPLPSSTPPSVPRSTPPPLPSQPPLPTRTPPSSIPARSAPPPLPSHSPSSAPPPLPSHAAPRGPPLPSSSSPPPLPSSKTPPPRPSHHGPPPGAPAGAVSLGALLAPGGARPPPRRPSGGRALPQPTGPTPGRHSACPPDERKQYTDIFSREVKSGGMLTGSQAFGLLSGAGLDQDDLASIWELADQDSDGNLTEEEFVVAMYLINAKLRGKITTIPTSLTPELKIQPGKPPAHGAPPPLPSHGSGGPPPLPAHGSGGPPPLPGRAPAIPVRGGPPPLPSHNPHGPPPLPSHSHGAPPPLPTYQAQAAGQNLQNKFNNFDANAAQQQAETKAYGYAGAQAGKAAMNRDNQARAGESIASKSDNQAVKFLARNKFVQQKAGQAASDKANDPEFQKAAGEKAKSGAKSGAKHGSSAAKSGASKGYSSYAPSGF